MKRIVVVFEVLYRTLRAYSALINLRLRKPQLYKSIKSNRRYKNLHKGQRCFIVGNGPSLKTQDVSLLKDEVVFTVNFISNYERFPEMETDYHFFSDPRIAGFVSKDSNSPAGYNAEAIRALNTPGNKPEVFFFYSARDSLEKSELRNELKCNFFMPNVSFQFAECVKYNYAGLLSGFSNTINYCIAMAIYMGFSEIYLTGCDCSFHLAIINKHEAAGPGQQYQYRHAYEESEETINKLAKMAEENISMESFYEGNYSLFKTYRIMNQFCMKKGIKLINCTNGGLLDCLPRKKFEDVITEKRGFSS